MARIAIEIEFLTSKMAAGSHFVKKNKATRSPEISREQVQKLTPQ